jgi:hypothetical protein
MDIMLHFCHGLVVFGAYLLNFSIFGMIMLAIWFLCSLLLCASPLSFTAEDRLGHAVTIICVQIFIILCALAVRGDLRVIPIPIFK